jgi:glucose-6-phosphate isomerase, archaeal
MIDLTPVTGLPLALDGRTGELAAGPGLVLEPPGLRRLRDLREVLADPMADPAGDDRPCYLLYRDVRLAGDETLLNAHRLRYDLTVTLPGRYGAELPKTAGHYHSRAPDGVGYPEVYEVLHGRAAFVLQWVDDPTAPEPPIRAVWVAICGPGEKIVIPPDCGHVTVNVGETPLVVGDLVAAGSTNEYGSYRRARGAAVYVLADGGAPPGFRVMRNERYRTVPDPVVAAGSRWHPLLDDDDPVYALARASPDRFAFLTAPQPHLRAMLALWTDR